VAGSVCSRAICASELKHKFQRERRLYCGPGISTASGDGGAVAHITWIEGTVFDDLVYANFFLTAIALRERLKFCTHPAEGNHLSPA
jgi:hypothetical protein